MIKILRQRRLPAGRQACSPPEGILLRRKNSKFKIQNLGCSAKISFRNFY